MCKVVKRGYFPSDEKDFSSESVQILYKAGCDLYYLLNQEYNIKGASTFVGNHYLLSERQRLALARAISSGKSIKSRRDKELKDNLEDSVVNIDGFNTIITLEVALSDSLLLKCMDGTIRDLAALRGTYRLIDKTELAITLIGEMLEKNKVREAIFYLDAPVSNSGKLKQHILECLNNFSFDVQVENINNVDAVLETLDNVITSDAIILDKCKSWINLNKKIIEERIGNHSYIDFSSLMDGGKRND
ncbi:DUF434 domain-containing protein [Clostridium cellulovorans]|uniref:DUF434 domain-containing protein n=1 Tax=Clostridium cellulovorans (strain ATCC 35296 / DSM 3052 / OCM 3 / 743B) TaxID=573061 RepID=D9SKB5_CLOC7|nr:DUF434 domain-containing protein [Clostridium cellulovorans]ADL51411.1 protein of unknown function DUF434 [Clostridium cellulovorans 743B]